MKPKPLTKNFVGAVLPDEIYFRILSQAESENRSIAHVTRQLLAKALDINLDKPEGSV